MKTLAAFIVSSVLIGALLWFQSNKSSQDLTQDFKSFTLGGKSTQKLQLAEIKKLEIIDKKSSKTLWQMVRLPDVVVRFQTPVTYTYYIDLNDDLKVSLKDGLLKMEFSQIKVNEPAADLSQMEFFVKEGSLLRNNQEALDSVRPELSKLLRQSSLQSLPEAEELARGALFELAMKWKQSGFLEFNELQIDINHSQQNKP